MTAEKDNLQEEMNDILSQKRQFEQEMEEFTEEVNVRVDEWKVRIPITFIIFNLYFFVLMTENPRRQRKRNI